MGGMCSGVVANIAPGSSGSHDVLSSDVRDVDVKGTSHDDDACMPISLPLSDILSVGQTHTRRYMYMYEQHTYNVIKRLKPGTYHI